MATLIQRGGNNGRPKTGKALAPSPILPSKKSHDTVRGRITGGSADDVPSRPRARSWSASSETAGLPYPRLVGLFALIALLYVGLAARLVWVQVVQHEYFTILAAQQRSKTILVPAQRGVLLDRNGALLVRNEPSVNIVLDPNLWYSKESKLGRETPEQRRARALVGLKKLLPNADFAAAQKPPIRGASGRFRTMDIVHRASLSVGDAVRSAKLPGVGVLNTTRRVAINGDMAPHVVGFTGRGGEGREGMEYGLDTTLAGKDGNLKAEFDNRRRLIPGTIASQEAVQPGRDIVLTIDSDIQGIVQNALAKVVATHRPEAAVALVMEPRTGDILAVANMPTYNVNHRAKAKPETLLNRAVALAFEPGSTLKLITACAALESGKATPDSMFFCTGNRKIGVRIVRCAHGEVHKNISLVGVIQKSCNVATADLGLRMGKKRLYQYERKFGFGARHGAGLPGEATGQVPPLDTWSDMRTANIAFGQGITVTPLQLACAYSAIANDGVMAKPRVIWGSRDRYSTDSRVLPAVSAPGRRVISAKTAQAARRMLLGVVETGTGGKAQIEGYTIGGKTGTAQMVENGHYVRKYVASFVGMAPMAKPEIVVLVAVTAPTVGHYGGDVAAPCFREIVEKTLLLRQTPRDRMKLEIRQLPPLPGEATDINAAKILNAPPSRNAPVLPRLPTDVAEGVGATLVDAPIRKRVSPSARRGAAPKSPKPTRRRVTLPLRGRPTSEGDPAPPPTEPSVGQRRRQRDAAAGGAMAGESATNAGRAKAHREYVA